MSQEGNISGKIVAAKKRIASALSEYAINWDVLNGTQDKDDLTGFLKIWDEEFKALKQPVTQETLLFQLANLLSNLEIQQDMLRAKKGWAKTDGLQAIDTLPLELAAIRDTVNTVSD